MKKIKGIELVQDGVSSEKMKKILGGLISRCVCSSGSARWNEEGGQANNCQCSYGYTNADYNFTEAWS